MANTVIRLGYVSISTGGGGVAEYSSLSAFPAFGQTGVLYLALDTRKVYTWSSVVYIEASPSEVVSVNTKVGVVVLDKVDIGLGNVDNTSDLDKPISNDTQDALDLKVDKAGDTMTGPLNMSALSENIQFSVYGMNSTSDIEIRSDDQTIKPSGNVKLTSGSAQGTDSAGSIYLTGGSNVDGNPANIILQAGISSGTGVNGSITLDSKQVVYLNQNPAGYVDAVNHNIQNVLDPVSPQDAATKKWVEDISAITNTLVVDPTASSFGANGSLFKPFVTIADALAIATDGTVIILLPGNYSEPQVVIPSTLKSLVFLGTSQSGTVVNNGFSYTAPADNIDVLFDKINVGQFTFDASLSLGGLVNIKQCSIVFNRLDNSNNVFMITSESTIFGGTLLGGPNNISECLIIVSFEVYQNLTIVENSKFVQRIEVAGSDPVIVRTLDCELFGAGVFVHGNGNTTWETDLATDALGTSVGVTKVLLANVPLSNITQSGANSNQIPMWSGLAWIPTDLDASVVTYTPDNVGDWSTVPNYVNQGLDELASRVSTGQTTVTDVFQDTHEPTGFVNRTDSSLSFDNGSRTLTITSVAPSFSVYHSGVKTTLTGSLSQSIPNATGSYYFYIDPDGLLQYSTTFDISILTQQAYCSYVYWSSSDNAAVIFGDERHGITMDGVTHGYLHTTRGTQLVSGASIGYSIGGDTVSLSDMQIKDEDITVNINNNPSPSLPFEQILSPSAKIPIIYREGASEWRKWSATTHPMLLQPGDIRASYNENVGGIWQLTEAPSNNKVLVSYVFATTSIEEPVMALLGQAQYNNIDEARGSASWDQVSFGDLPSPEMKLLYTIYYETSSSFASVVKSQISHVSDLRFTHDREVSATVFNSDHANLSGLAIGDDHPQYLNQTRGDARYNIKSLGDIAEGLFSLSNNQSLFSNITGFSFSNAIVRSFEAQASVKILANSNSYEEFTICGVQKDSSWDISIKSVGDITGIEFSITSAGQLQYTSPSFTGFISGVIKFRALTTSV